MSKKLTFSDIVDLFVAKTGQTKKEADAFLRELLDIMSSNVCEDGLVKLRDFGTFKVVDVESRESVDVNTGAKIVIASHRKISFTPDKNLKDLVNKPFSLFQPELLNEGVNFEQTDIDKLIDDESDDVETDFHIEEVQSSPQTMSVENINITEENVEKLSETENDVEPQKTIEGENTHSQLMSTPEEEKPIQEKLITTEQISVEPEQINEPKRRNMKKLWTIAGICFIILIILGVAFFYFNSSEDRATAPIKPETTVEKDTTSAPKPHIEIIKNDSLSQSPVDSEQQKESVEEVKPEKVTKSEQPKPTESVAKTVTKSKSEVISDGETFRTLALKYYGSKDYWVYIYQANKSTVPNPNKLKAGLKLTIPDAKSLGIDAKDPNSIKHARQLSSKVLNELK